MPTLRSSPNLNQLGAVSKSQPCFDRARHRAKWNWVRYGESTMSKLGLTCNFNKHRVITIIIIIIIITVVAIVGIAV